MDDLIPIPALPTHKTRFPGESGGTGWYLLADISATLLYSTSVMLAVRSDSKPAHQRD